MTGQKKGGRSRGAGYARADLRTRGSVEGNTMKASNRKTNLPLKAALFLLIGLSPLSVARVAQAQSTDMAEKVMRRHQMLNPPSEPAPGQSAPVSTPQNPPAGTAAQAPPTVSVACVPDPKLA